VETIVRARGETTLLSESIDDDDAPVTRQFPSINFWQTKAFLWFLSPPICQISFYSPSSKNLKGRHFGTLDNIHKCVTDELKGIPAEAFQHCYKQWKQRLRHCVAAQGNYFERDNLEYLFFCPAM
jgi:hypothetical protein